jgi:hypothetical protein
MAKKRVTRKLTDHVRENIRSEYNKLRLSDYDGDALTYLKKVRGAAKARKAKAAKVAKVGELKIPVDSEIYRIVEKAAKMKKMTVKAFVKKHRASIEALMKDGDFVVQRETEYLISDIQHLPKGKKVLVNDGDGYHKTTRLKDIYDIQQFTQHVASYSNIFLLVYRVHYKLDGNLSHYLPPVDVYEAAEEEQEVIDLLDEYYPEITYLISQKKSDKDVQEEPKIIEPDAPERKKRKKKSVSKIKQAAAKGKSKGKSDNGRKRKAVR